MKRQTVSRRNIENLFFILHVCDGYILIVQYFFCLFLYGCLLVFCVPFLCIKNPYSILATTCARRTDTTLESCVYQAQAQEHQINQDDKIEFERQTEEYDEVDSISNGITPRTLSHKNPAC